MICLAPTNQAVLSLLARSLQQMVQRTQFCTPVFILVESTAQFWEYKHWLPGNGIMQRPAGQVFLCLPEGTIRHNASGIFVTLQLEQVRRVFVGGGRGMSCSIVMALPIPFGYVGVFGDQR